MPTETELRDVIAAFIKVARHIRNFPHPQLTIGQLKSEAVQAERLAEKFFGEKEYQTMNDIAFIDT